MRAGSGFRSAMVAWVAMSGGAAAGQRMGHGHGLPPGYPPLAGGPIVFPGYGLPYGYYPGPWSGPGTVGLGPWSYLPPAPSVIIGGDLQGPSPSSSSTRAAAIPRATSAERSAHLVTLGDRFFRASDTRRAADRYVQAAEADRRSAEPHIHLAQLDILKGRYAEAADRLREALSVEPGCLANARDIRALYGEPTEFAKAVARIEAHLQAEPDDRDAWLVLGAEFYLSGQTNKAADVFLRLTDRRSDPALTAFLDASRAGEARERR